MNIGERIKFLRKNKLKLTQEEFGNRIGVKANTITNYECGNRIPLEQTIKSICREYNVNYFWLTEGGNDDDMFLPEPTGVLDELKIQYNLSDVEVEILNNYLKLSKSQRDDFIEAMKKIFKLNT